MGNQYECEICHGRCDPGELTQGICPECEIAHMQAEMNRQELNRMITATNYRQMTMEEFLK